MTIKHLALVAVALIAPLGLVSEVRGAVGHSGPTPVASTDAGPAATFDEFLAAISGSMGQKRDRAHIHTLFHPQARFWIVTGDSVVTKDANEALDGAIDSWEQHGFFESCTHHETQTWGHWAQVECTYEIRPSGDAPVSKRGTNGAQLTLDGGRWKILSVYWEAESQTDRIPETLR
jgi:hypothetical protein